MLISYLNRLYHHYNSNLGYHYISLDHSFIPVETDYQRTPKVTKQETKETNYKGTKTEDQTGSKNSNWS